MNYIVRNLADHLGRVSHDRINPYLRSETLTPRLLKIAKGQNQAWGAWAETNPKKIGNLTPFPVED